MYRFLSSTAFLSGCIPIALINLILNYKHEDYVIAWFAAGFMVVSTIAGLYFWCQLKRFYRKENQRAIVVNIKRKDLFASGAISYYVLPLISFVSSGRGGVLILIVLILLFVRIFNNNRMFLYTPLFDILGYKILECELKVNNTIINADIITQDGNKMFFTGENMMRIMKIEEGIYAAELSES